MSYSARHCMLLALLFGWAPALTAQNVADSLNSYRTLIGTLVKESNFEQAQVEAENLRAFLKRRQVFCPDWAVPALSEIYRHNKNEESALAFLADAAHDARRDQNPDTRAALLTHLVNAYTVWNQPHYALASRELLEVARDSISERQRRADLLHVQRQLDSLVQLRQSETAALGGFFRIQRSYTYGLAGLVALLFLGLLSMHWKSKKKWRKRLEKKDLEIDFIRSDRYAEALQIAPVPAVETPEPATSAYERSSYFPPDGKRPDKTALLIEPNRQIVLYLKSLLSDRFEIETAHTPSEGIQLASNRLPDLIVCDAVLNGQTGIDVTRQIKLSERTNHIPVILLTERFGNDGKLDALRAGADTWFHRPVLDTEFDGEVSRLLDAQKARHQLFARCLHLYFSENRLLPEESFLQRTLQFADEHLADPDFMADDLARKMQMHKPHYVKKLQALTGKEPVQLIRELRLEKAKVLLEKRAGTPQAISEMVGFASSGSFALAFKEYFGENTTLLQMPDRRS